MADLLSAGCLCVRTAYNNNGSMVWVGFEKLKTSGVPLLSTVVCSSKFSPKECKHTIVKAVTHRFICMCELKGLSPKSYTKLEVQVVSFSMIYDTYVITDVDSLHFYVRQKSQVISNSLQIRSIDPL